MKLCPDSGATISLCSKDVADRFHLQVQADHQVKLKDGQGRFIKCLGVAKLYKTPGGQKRGVKEVVTPAMTKQLLVSWKDQVKLGFLPDNYPQVITSNPKNHKKEQKRWFRK